MHRYALEVVGVGRSAGATTVRVNDGEQGSGLPLAAISIANPIAFAAAALFSLPVRRAKRRESKAATAHRACSCVCDRG